jgi:hypothetical protein
VYIRSPNTARAERMSQGAGDRQITHLMKSLSKLINVVLSPSMLGAGITMIKELLTAKFAKGLGGGGGGGGGGLFGGEVDSKFLRVNVEGKMCGTT